MATCIVIVRLLDFLSVENVLGMGSRLPYAKVNGQPLLGLPEPGHPLDPWNLTAELTREIGNLDSFPIHCDLFYLGKFRVWGIHRGNERAGEPIQEGERIDAKECRA